LAIRVLSVAITSSGINPLAIANFAREVRAGLVAREHPAQQVQIFILEVNELSN
jgi:hypothetical protein